MLNKVEYVFPATGKNKKLFKLLLELLKGVQYVNTPREGEIHIGDAKLKPVTIFRLDDDANYVHLVCGDSKFFNLTDRNTKKPLDVKRISGDEVLSKLAGRIHRVDHTGFNLPMSSYTEAEWNDLLKRLAGVCNVYNYPSGEPWPFVLPATQAEHKAEITDFTLLREPKFEIVYDDFTNMVAIHIDMQTDMTKQQTEKLFPSNKGVYFSTLNDIFKSIYLDYCDSIDIRLDLRFTRPQGDFESGKWLVREGGRIKS